MAPGYPLLEVDIAGGYWPEERNLVPSYRNPPEGLGEPGITIIT
jgi:hypothetical protein